MLELVRHGRTNKQIAAQLGLSVYTVRDHASSLLAKTGAENRTALALAPAAPIA